MIWIDSGEQGVPVEWAVVADGRHHDDVVRAHLQDLIYKWPIHEVRATDAQIENVDLLVDGIVERVKEPRSERY